MLSGIAPQGFGYSWIVFRGFAYSYRIEDTHIFADLINTQTSSLSTQEAGVLISPIFLLTAKAKISPLQSTSIAPPDHVYGG